MIRFVNFRASDIEPNPDEVMYWVDLNEDPRGGMIKYWDVFLGCWRTIRVLEGTLAEIEQRIYDWVEKHLSDQKEYIDGEIQRIDNEIVIIQKDIKDLQDNKQDTLIPGYGIAISEDNVITCTVDLTLYKVVSELPTQNIDSTKIYIVFDKDGIGNNTHEEYVYIEDEQRWELLGKYADYASRTDFLQEIEDRKAADAQLQANIDSEAATRAQADRDLSNRIDTTNSKLDNEISRSSQEDSKHDQNIAALQNKDTQLQQSIDEEVTERENEVTRLDSRIDTEETIRYNADMATNIALSGHPDTIVTKFPTSTSTDTYVQLQGGKYATREEDYSYSEEKNLDTVTIQGATTTSAGVMSSHDKRVLNNLGTIEYVSYIKDDNAFSSDADSVAINFDCVTVDGQTQQESPSIHSVDLPVVSSTNAGVMTAADKVKLDTTIPNQIAAEQQARQQADEQLQSNIDAEEAARIAADNTITQNLNTEISNRKSEVTRLEQLITESSGELSTDLQNEIDRATAAEQALQTSITNEVSRATQAEKNISDTLSPIKTAWDARNNSNGLIQADSTGKIPSSVLPSYVDDVLEYDSLTAFPATGETGKIYIAKDTNKTYRWSGSTYTVVSETLALGETSSTAYAGDKGKANRDALSSMPERIVDTFPNFSTTSSTVTMSGGTYVVKTGLNYGASQAISARTIPAATTSAAGVMTASDKAKLSRIGSTDFTLGTVSTAANTVTIAATKKNNADGSSITNNITIPAATTSAAGVLTATDKAKLDGIAAGANNYTLPAATSTVLGGVKLGYSTSGKNYAIQKDANNNLYVNVPWTDTVGSNTTYTFASGSTGNFTVTPSGGSAQTISIGKPVAAASADYLTVNREFVYTNTRLRYDTVDARYNTSIIGTEVGVRQSPDQNMYHIIRPFQGDSNKFYAELAIPLSNAHAPYSMWYRSIQRGTSTKWYRLVTEDDLSTIKYNYVTTYTYDEINNVRYYWAKIAHINAVGSVTLDLYVYGDINFAFMGTGTLTINGYTNAANFSVALSTNPLHLNHTYPKNGIYVCLTTTGDVWIKSYVEWTSGIQYAVRGINNAAGIELYTGDDIEYILDDFPPNYTDSEGNDGVIFCNGTIRYSGTKQLYEEYSNQLNNVEIVYNRFDNDYKGNPKNSGLCFSIPSDNTSTANNIAVIKTANGIIRSVIGMYNHQNSVEGSSSRFITLCPYDSNAAWYEQNLGLKLFKAGYMTWNGNNIPISHYTTASMNLNDLGSTIDRCGFITNVLDANATQTNNYPIQKAGGGFYTLGPYDKAMQMYGTFSSNQWFVRGGGHQNSDRTAWKQLVTIPHTYGNGTAVGSSTIPVYIAANGVATACSGILYENLLHNSTNDIKFRKIFIGYAADAKKNYILFGKAYTGTLMKGFNFSGHISLMRGEATATNNNVGLDVNIGANYNNNFCSIIATGNVRGTYRPVTLTYNEETYLAIELPIISSAFVSVYGVFRNNIDIQLVSADDVTNVVEVTNTNTILATSAQANKTTGTLTFIGAATGTFNGSSDVTINIPTSGGVADSVTWANVTNKPISGSTSILTTTGTLSHITTEQFLEKVQSMVGSNQYGVWRGSWSYSNNDIVDDVPGGALQLAGCVIEYFGRDKVHQTIRVTTPTTSTQGINQTKRILVYINNGDTYSPGWYALARVDELEALQNSLAAVATSGSYNDLTNKPTIPVDLTSRVVALETALQQLQDTLNAHIANKSNPHEVTAAQLSLGTTDNVRFAKVNATGGFFKE